MPDDSSPERLSQHELNHARLARTRGGAEIDRALKWAGQNLPQPDRDRINTEFGGTPDRAAVALGEVQARMGGATAFRTAHEMRAAMKTSAAQLGTWEADASLVARIAATPPAIRASF